MKRGNDNAMFVYVCMWISFIASNCVGCTQRMREGSVNLQVKWMKFFSFHVRGCNYETFYFIIAMSENKTYLFHCKNEKFTTTLIYCYTACI